MEDRIRAFEDTQEPKTFRRRRYKDTHIISSKLGYLIGVEKRFFEFEDGSLDIDIFNSLEQDRAAKIVRNLCIVRTLLMRRNKLIREEINYNFKTIDTIPDLIPTEIFEFLRKEGIYIIRSPKRSAHQYIVDFNLEISNRINNCKHLFPTWVVWEYIRNLFIMPDGLTTKGAHKEMRDNYFIKKKFYPFTCYINWNPRDVGNLLESDRALLTYVYEDNGAEFKNLNCVTQITENTREDILDFVDNSKTLDIIVDCENVNPFRLAVALNQMSEDIVDHMNKLILINDPNTPKVWNYFKALVPSYDVEHVQMERINEKKSLVDIGFTAKLCEEHYKNNVDSFIICSSDSDFWGVIKTLPTVNYMVLVENERMGRDLREALSDAGILYVYMEDFYEGEEEEIGLKNRVIFYEFKKKIKEVLDFNLSDMLSEVLRETFIEMSFEEKEQLLKNFISINQIAMKKDGSVELERK